MQDFDIRGRNDEAVMLVGFSRYDYKLESMHMHVLEGFVFFFGF
jgi:hypothetical protein